MEPDCFSYKAKTVLWYLKRKDVVHIPHPTTRIYSQLNDQFLCVLFIHRLSNNPSSRTPMNFANQKNFQYIELLHWLMTMISIQMHGCHCSEVLPP